MMKLLIAEKYKVAQCFSKLLKCNKRDTHFDKGVIGYFCNDEWIVTWASGHLVQPVYPSGYSKEYDKWDINNLPILPKDFKYEVSNYGKKQFNAIKDIFKKFKITEIYHAADADREGELIVREILREIKIPKNIKCYRVWYTNTTDSTLEKAIKEAKPLSDYDNLYEAADCRQKIDWDFGINMSRAFTVKAHSTQNVGRVISPTINLVVERQKLIDNFNPEDYAIITVPIKKDNRKFNVDARFDDIKFAKDLAPKLKGKDAKIKIVDNNEEKEDRKLFNTTQLQAECSKRFNFSPDTTMTLMQTLYEQGYITYPRTKSCSINKEQKKETNLLLVPTYNKVFGSPKTLDPNKFDIKKIIDKQGSSAEEASHTGLCPTMKGIDEYSRIASDDKLNKVFSTIASRLLCAVSPSRVVSKSKIVVDIEEQEFQANGSVEKDPGFYNFEVDVRKKLEPKYKPRSSDNDLPSVEIGEIFKCLTAKCVEKQTSPPEQYTIAQLLSTMENISRLVEDKKLKEAIKDGGLGTPSSRDTVIKTMQDSNFVVLKDKRLYPTEKAKNLMDLLPEDVKSPIMTAKMEVELDKIASGKGDKEKTLKAIEDRVCKEIDYIKTLPDTPDKERYKDNKLFIRKACPKCGEDIVETDKAMTCRYNCGFKIWKTMAKKKLTKGTMRELLIDGHTSTKIKGFKSNKGNDFSCYLYIDSKYDIKFDFDDSGFDAKNNNIISLRGN